MRCVETTEYLSGMTRRRYVDESGAEHITQEVPASVISSIGAKKLRRELAQAKKSAAVRVRIAKIKQRLAEGKSTASIALEFGLSVSRIQQILLATKQRKPS